MSWHLRETSKPERILSPRQTEAFARVGSTGNSTGPHLHLERHPAPAPPTRVRPRRARVDSLARAAVVTSIALFALVGVGIASNGGTTYTCPGGDATDLSLCEVQP